MRLFGLIGFPLSHSFSHSYFSEKFVREHISGCLYRLFPIEDISRLPELVSAEPALEGLNVTIPYKQKVLPYLEAMSLVVQDTGACNCIKVRDGKLYGFNTDVNGFERALEKRLLPRHNRALILGTGGAAGAVAWVLNKRGIPFRYVSSSGSRDALRYEDLTEADLTDYPLIVNTTPLGMYPDTGKAPAIPYTGITSRHLLYDLIYNPAQTLFLQKGAEKGADTLNGLEMLTIQAEESWKIWNSSVRDGELQ
jgi:shikimate dehydrogenase